jgi:hypothetical protein
MKLAGSLLTMTCVTIGSVACATPAAGQAMYHQAGGYEVQVLVDGVPAPTFQHAGETYVLGQMGARYQLRVLNHTGRRIEAVLSVDGRDVVDGKPADFRNKRGYLVPAWGTVDIDGWRLSQRQAAAFRFSSVADSYAGRMGTPREVGVIGVAVFPERTYYNPPRPRPIYPQYRDYPREEYESYGYGRGDDERKRSAEPPPPASPSPSLSEAPARDSAGPGVEADASSKAKSGSGAGGYASRAPSRRPGLGTEFGEAVTSHIREVDFVRANSGRPSVVLGVRYNDRAGLMAVGIDLDNAWGPDDTYLRQTARPFPVSSGYAAPPPGWRRQW